MDKVTYSSDTTAAVPGAALSVARYGLAATGNSIAGYFGVGYDFGVGIYSIMDKVTYSTDTTSAVPSARLSSDIGYSYVAATGSSSAGYFGGGDAPQVSTMDKLTYSTDTTARIPGGNLSAPRGHLAASSSTANAVRGTVPQVSIV